MKYFSTLVALLVAALGFASIAFAQGISAARFKTKSGVDIMVDARNLSRDMDRQVIELKDDVRVIYGDQSFRADAATIYLATDEVEARGNVTVQSVSSRIEADWFRV